MPIPDRDDDADEGLAIKIEFGILLLAQLIVLAAAARYVWTVLSALF